MWARQGWGRNDSGQLRNSTTQDRNVPDVVSGLTDALAVIVTFTLAGKVFTPIPLSGEATAAAMHAAYARHIRAALEGLVGRTAMTRKERA